MPILRNDNKNRVFPRDRADLTISPGQVREINGDDADLLLALNGVTELEGDDGRKALDAQRAEHGPSGAGPDSPVATIEGAVSAAHLLQGQVTAGMNSRVIGDDQAPHGPPTGTVTTKQAVQKDDPAHFGPGEAGAIGEVSPQVPSPTGEPTSADVHNDQVKNAAESHEAAAAIIESAGAAPAADDAEPEPLSGADLDAAFEAANIDTSEVKGDNKDGSISADQKRQLLAEQQADTAGA